MLTLDDVTKALENQKVRAFDTYALGPFMIWYAMKSKSMGRWPRRTLFVAGAMTIVYNFAKYRQAAAFLKENGNTLVTHPIDSLILYSQEQE